MNGLIKQWGCEPLPSGDVKTNVIFSLKYNNVPVIQVTSRGSSDADFGMSYLGQVIGTKDGFTCDSNSGNIGKVRIDWLTIGY